MQGTVASFVPDSWTGTVLLDDGLEIPFESAALVDSGLRLLRPGQRVRLEVSGLPTAPRIERLQILTLS